MQEAVQDLQAVTRQKDSLAHSLAEAKRAGARAAKYAHQLHEEVEKLRQRSSAETADRIDAKHTVASLQAQVEIVPSIPDQGSQHLLNRCEKGPALCCSAGWQTVRGTDYSLWPAQDQDVLCDHDRHDAKQSQNQASHQGRYRMQARAADERAERLAQEVRRRRGNREEVRAQLEREAEAGVKLQLQQRDLEWRQKYQVRHPKFSSRQKDPHWHQTLASLATTEPWAAWRHAHHAKLWLIRSARSMPNTSVRSCSHEFSVKRPWLLNAGAGGAAEAAVKQ